MYFIGGRRRMIKVFEAFAGVGSQRMALDNLGIPHEVVAISEIDKFAIASYEAIHGPTVNLGDISQLKPEDIPDHDLFTYSFPCQDISVAGKQSGLDMDSGTRSGLLWECQKVIATKKPKYLLLENVKNLVGKRHKANFDLWLDWLVEQGYSNYWQVLNAKDYGIPQNRERVFVVSILGEHESYVFPEKQELKLRLKDVLESEVNEKFYLNDDRVAKLNFNLSKVSLPNNELKVVGNTSATNYNKSNVYHDSGICPTIAARDYKGPNQVLQVGQYDTDTRNNSNRFRTHSVEGTSPSLTTMGGGGLEPCVLIKNATAKGYLEATDGDGIDLAYPDSQTRRGRVQKESSPTLQTTDSVGTVEIDNYPQVLRKVRTEFGKQIRKKYESGEVKLKRAEMTELIPRTDGISNTLTTVQKDNYVLEGVDVHPFSKKLEFRGYKQNEVSPCLLATDYKAPKTILESQTNSSHVQKDDHVVEPSSEKVIIDDTMGFEKEARVYEDYSPSLRASRGGLKTMSGQDFRIRKLTPLECWRLMGFKDLHFYKAQEVNSNSQLYKQAGNSIVVPVLEGIFRKLI